jgi:enolase
MASIYTVRAREILDSRGIPTVEATMWLDDGISVTTSVPAGTSTSKSEALELRDGDDERFFGMGVLKAVANVNEVIAPKLKGMDPGKQGEIDKMLIDLDGSTNKKNLGANAILAVSQAVCKAGAAVYGIPVYQYLQSKYRMIEELSVPVPLFNLINGGKHGAGNLDFQEFHLIPSSRFRFVDSYRLGAEVYHQLEKALINNNAIHSVGKEGGFSPNLFTNLDALEIIFEATKMSKYDFGHDVFLGLDVAASNFYKNGRYQIKDRSQSFTNAEFIEYYKDLNNQYHLFALEDPLNEDDWQSWIQLTEELSRDTIIVGDDLLSTNKELVKKAIKEKACNAVLVKPNQIGTITETVEVINLARSADWSVIVSHRSGETTGSFIADFAVGVGSDYVKFGAPSRGERVVKYNRLLQIESELDSLKSQAES